MRFTERNTYQEIQNYVGIKPYMEILFSDFLDSLYPEEIRNRSLEEAGKIIGETPWGEPFAVINEQLLAAANECLQLIGEFDSADESLQFVEKDNDEIQNEKKCENENENSRKITRREVIPLWSMQEKIWSFPKKVDSGKGRVFLIAPAITQCSRESKPALIICPGGGYEEVCFTNEGSPMQNFFEEHGFVTFMLNYRVAPDRYPAPQLDLTLAILYVRAHCEAYGVDPSKIGIMGSSAGGHLCAYQPTCHEKLRELVLEELRDTNMQNGSHEDSMIQNDQKRNPQEKNHPTQKGKMKVLDRDMDSCTEYQDVSARPDFVCLNYPVISFASEMHEGSFQSLTGGEESMRQALSVETLVTETYPPTFVWACADDETVPASNAVRMGEALRQSGVYYECHIYPTGGHGCGLAEYKSAREWSGKFLQMISTME